MGIEVRKIAKNFGTFQALRDVSLEIPSGQLVALLGPSGSGKTTLLRIIAGLEVPDSGTVLFQGEDATAQSIQDRKVGFVFQHYALFKHMTVFENVAFGLRVRPRRFKLNEQEIRAKVEKLLKLVQMEWLADRYPSQLSGGQQQRIALARALAVEPNIMLLDEPFGALDAKVRKELRRWIRKLHDDIHLTSLFVTHDQDEALEVADRVVIMNEGRIEQIGTPEEVYDHPVNPFVYQFLGNVNLFRGRVNKGRVSIGASQLEIPELQSVPNSAAVAYTRPHEVEVALTRSGPDDIAAVVSYIRAIGPIVRLELKRGDTGELIDAELPKESYRRLQLQMGTPVFVQLKNVKVYVEDYCI